MATLTVQEITLSSLTPSYASADAGGDEFSNTGRTFLHIINDGASSITATIDSRTNCSQGFDHNIEVTVGASSEKMVGPFKPGRFNDDNGITDITYSAVTSVTVAAIALGS